MVVGQRLVIRSEVRLTGARSLVILLDPKSAVVPRWFPRDYRVLKVQLRISPLSYSLKLLGLLVHLLSVEGSPESIPMGAFEDLHVLDAHSSLDILLQQTRAGFDLGVCLTWVDEHWFCPT